MKSGGASHLRRSCRPPPEIPCRRKARMPSKENIVSLRATTTRQMPSPEIFPVPLHEHGWGTEAVSTPKGKRIVLWSSPGFRCELVRHEGGTWLRTAFGTIPFHPRLDTGTRPCPIDRQVESISSAEQGRYFGGDLLGLGFLQILHLRLKMVDAPVYYFFGLRSGLDAVSAK
jgi:hypothetical protein